MVLKVAVLSSGVVLADGEPVDLGKLDEMLRAVKAANGSLWYYREQSADPAVAGMEVIKLAVGHKVAISISSKPDYSDYVDAKGVSHPRAESAAAEAVRMPEVAVSGDIEQVFLGVRQTAAGGKGTRGLVVVAPDRRMLLMPALEVSEKLTELAAGMERLIPSSVKRNIAVIACTEIAAGAGDAFDVAAAGRAIPFLGLLTGLTYIGHSVWIFEGHPSALAAGCREADVLVVDSAMVPNLSRGWEDTASAAMRNANIVLHDRATHKLRFVRKAGESRDRLEFPH
jgi:hypothetical protein